MKLRHAVPLTLIGWYLMVPPLIPNTHEINKSAPLSQWMIRRTFPHNAGCEATKYQLRKRALAAEVEFSHHGRRGNPDLYCIPCNAECVAIGDPRLKGR